MGDGEDSPGADQVTVREHRTDPGDFAAADGITLCGSPRRDRDVLDACVLEAAARQEGAALRCVETRCRRATTRREATVGPVPAPAVAGTS